MKTVMIQIEVSNPGDVYGRPWWKQEIKDAFRKEAREKLEAKLKEMFQEECK